MTKNIHIDNEDELFLEISNNIIKTLTSKEIKKGKHIETVDKTINEIKNILHEMETFKKNDVFKISLAGDDFKLTEVHFIVSVENVIQNENKTVHLEVNHYHALPSKD